MEKRLDALSSVTTGYGLSCRSKNEDGYERLKSDSHIPVSYTHLLRSVNLFVWQCVLLLVHESFVLSAKRAVNYSG